jgi:hypothetical protein
MTQDGEVKTSASARTLEAFTVLCVIARVLLLCAYFDNEKYISLLRLQLDSTTLFTFPSCTTNARLTNALSHFWSDRWKRDGWVVVPPHSLRSCGLRHNSLHRDGTA